MDDQGKRIRNALIQLLDTDADAALIAATAVSIWRDVEQKLSPVIGRRAVVALYGRSLYLTRVAYTCLSPVPENDGENDFAVLRTALTTQSSAQAVVAQNALFEAFLQLLSRLIGKSLTGRLLESVLPSSSSDAAAQETPS
ncbi:MAG: hypothetical protein ABW106_11965 [Steroidobacteraceae bacterium]